MISSSISGRESIKLKKPAAFLYGDFEEWLNSLPMTFGFSRIEYHVSRNGGDGTYFVYYYPTKKDGKDLEGFKELLRPYKAD
jgi:hypothetical protein